jgi:putative transposase
LGQPLVVRTSANQEWALDFLHDAVECGRVPSVVDVPEDVWLWRWNDFRQPEGNASVGCVRGRAGTASHPLRQRPELTSRHFPARAWSAQPGKPTQNARVESVHGRLREECVRVSWFQNLFDARGKIVAWRREYYEERPHRSLGYRTPKEFVVFVRERKQGKVNSALLTGSLRS